MTSCFLTQHVPPAKACACDDCEWTGTADDVGMISDIQERLTPGYEVPVGECPECGALAFLTLAEPASDRAEVEKLRQTAADLLAALKAVTPYAHSRAEDMHEAGGDQDADWLKANAAVDAANAAISAHEIIAQPETKETEHADRTT